MQQKSYVTCNESCLQLSIRLHVRCRSATGAQLNLDFGRTASDKVFRKVIFQMRIILLKTVAVVVCFLFFFFFLDQDPIPSGGSVTLMQLICGVHLCSRLTE